jgi:hypothetical protein
VVLGGHIPVALSRKLALLFQLIPTVKYPVVRVSRCVESLLLGRRVGRPRDAHDLQENAVPVEKRGESKEMLAFPLNTVPNG